MRRPGRTSRPRVDRPHDEVVGAITAEGPYDLVIDYLWGRPAEAVFTALTRTEPPAERIRYILVGMTAGETATLSAMALRRAPVQLAGSGIGGAASITDAAAGYADLLQQVAAGEIMLDIDPVPLADVESVWPKAGTERRVVFVPCPLSGGSGQQPPVRPRDAGRGTPRPYG